MTSTMSTFSISVSVEGFSKEVAEVSGAIAFRFRGSEGMVMLLSEGVGAGLVGAIEGAAEGLPTTVVFGVEEGGAEALEAERRDIQGGEGRVPSTVTTN